MLTTGRYSPEDSVVACVPLPLRCLSRTTCLIHLGLRVSQVFMERGSLLIGLEMW